MSAPAALLLTVDDAAPIPIPEALPLASALHCFWWSLDAGARSVRLAEAGGRLVVAVYRRTV